LSLRVRERESYIIITARQRNREREKDGGEKGREDHITCKYSLQSGFSAGGQRVWAVLRHP